MAWAGPWASAVCGLLPARWTVSLDVCRWQRSLTSGSPSRSVSLAGPGGHLRLCGKRLCVVGGRHRLPQGVSGHQHSVLGFPVCLENRVQDAGLRTAPWSGVWMKRMGENGPRWWEAVACWSEAVLSRVWGSAGDLFEGAEGASQTERSLRWAGPRTLHSAGSSASGGLGLWTVLGSSLGEAGF